MDDVARGWLILVMGALAAAAVFMAAADLWPVLVLSAALFPDAWRSLR